VSRVQKEKLIQEIEQINNDDRFKPSQIADLVGINRSTCKNYLDTLSELFEPTELTDNDYRLYDGKVVRRMCLFKALKTRPIKLNNEQTKTLFSKVKDDELWAKFKQSANALEALARSMI